MFGASEQERFLAAMFSDQYGAEQGGKELLRFLDQLAQVQLPFDLVGQMRRLDRPGFAGFECGLPPQFYYFVPGAGYGGHNPPPSDPLAPGFVYAVDGGGLNFGNPLRLKRALAALLRLLTAAQEEARRNLAVASKHLSTVEELVWAGVWQPPYEVERPVAGGAKSHDWKIVFHDLTLNLECKFVPASWPALVDGDEFRLMKGALLGKAGAQLPNPAPTGTVNVAAITGIAPVNDGLRQLCHSELQDHPHVPVIVYADIVGQMTVFSLSNELAEQVHRKLERLPADEFGGFATITSYRPENARRLAARQTQPATAGDPSRPSGLVELVVKSLPPRRLFTLPPPQYPYRFALDKRLPSGEPVFVWVPPFLPTETVRS